MLGRGRQRLGRGLLGRWGVVALATAAAVAGLLPPSAVPADGLTERFSAERAFNHVEVIADRPHPMGSAAIEGVRAYIIGQLLELGLSPETQSVNVADYFGSPTGTVPVVNVMARLPGTAPTGAVALVAHYDTTPMTPGANDDAVGVATLIETARAILEGPAPRNDVILLFTDGEEPEPRFGATAFVESHPWFKEIGLVVNFEAIGGTGPSMLVETSGPGGWLIPEFARAVRRPVAFSYASGIADLLGGVGTDFDPFRAKGVPGLSFAYLHGSTIYHTMADTPNSVGTGSLQHHGENALSVARKFGELDLSDPGGAEMVHFSLLGRSLVSHPANWMAPIAIVAGLMLAIGLAAVRRRGRRSFSSMTRGAGVVVLALVVASLLAVALWKLVAQARPTVGVLEGYLYLAAMIGLTIAGVSWMYGKARHRPGLDLESGGLIVWSVFALATALTMAKISYLFVWPTLAAATALLWSLRGSPGPWSRLGQFVLVAVPTLLLNLPAIDTFFQFAQPRPGNTDSQLLEAIAVSIFLVGAMSVLVLPYLVNEPIDSPVDRPNASGRHTSAHTAVM